MVLRPKTGGIPVFLVTASKTHEGPILRITGKETQDQVWGLTVGILKLSYRGHCGVDELSAHLQGTCKVVVRGLCGGGGKTRET